MKVESELQELAVPIRKGRPLQVGGQIGIYTVTTVKYCILRFH